MAREPLVDQWLEHLTKNLEEMAHSWSSLAEPIGRILAMLEGVDLDDSFRMTADFRQALDTLQAEIARCPIIQDHPTAYCFPPPNGS